MFKNVYSLNLFCILHPACVSLSVCSLHFTLSLHFTPGPQSAVCSPQSSFYTDRFCSSMKDVFRGYQGHLLSLCISLETALTRLAKLF